MCMKNMAKKLIIVFYLLGLGTALRAQEALSVTGGNASGSGGSVSYTIGQVAYQTHNGTNGSVAVGYSKLTKLR
jgi:hypothetical protein